MGPNHPMLGAIICAFLAFFAGKDGHEGLSKMMGVFVLLFLLFSYRVWKSQRGY